MFSEYGILFFILLAACGLAVGSFLNVAAYRLPRDLSVVRPGSACLACNSPIRFYDNIPVLSYILLGGKCRRCKQPISPRYPEVEIVTAIVWMLIGTLFRNQPVSGKTVAALVLCLGFVSASLVAFLTDMDGMIIPDEISLGGLAVSLAASPFVPLLHHASLTDSFYAHHAVLANAVGRASPWLRSVAASVAGAAVGALASLAIMYAGGWFFNKQVRKAQEDDPDIHGALGWGDVKLMAFFGAFLGPNSVLWIYVGASCVGACFGAAYKLWTGDAEGKSGWCGLKARWANSTSVTPLGPYLSSCAVGWLFYSGVG